MIRRLVLSVALLATIPAYAAESHLVATDGWLRLLPGSLPAGGYVTLTNTSARPIEVKDVSSPDYKDAMLHQSSESEGMARMNMVHAVAIPPKQTVVLSPGGYHVMLGGPTHPLKPGDTVTVRLTLSDGTSVPAKLRVRPANASGPTD